MARTSIIAYPASEPVVVIHKSLVTACAAAPDPVCAAAILSNFIYWTEIKLGSAVQAEEENKAAANNGLEPTQLTDAWIWRSNKEIQEDILSLSGLNAVATAIHWLVDNCFVSERTNPRYKWDRKKQYLVHTTVVQAAVSLDSTLLKEAVQAIKTQRDSEQKEAGITYDQKNHSLELKDYPVNSNEAIQRILRESLKDTSYLSGEQTELKSVPPKPVAKSGEPVIPTASTRATPKPVFSTILPNGETPPNNSGKRPGKARIVKPGSNRPSDSVVAEDEKADSDFNRIRRKLMEIFNVSSYYSSNPVANPESSKYAGFARDLLERIKLIKATHPEVELSIEELIQDTYNDISERYDNVRATTITQYVLEQFEQKYSKKKKSTEAADKHKAIINAISEKMKGKS